MGITAFRGVPFSPDHPEVSRDWHRLKYICLKAKKAIGRPLAMLRKPIRRLSRVEVRAQRVDNRRIVRDHVVNRVAGNEVAGAVNPEMGPLCNILAQDFWSQD